MKIKIGYLLLAVSCLLAGYNVFAQAKLEVVVKNVKDTKGLVRVGLYSNENEFLKKIAVGKTVKASEKELTVVFENLEPGEYAMSIIHDENENGELDSNLFGIPKEGFAFGNNAMGTFGPPSFEKAKLTVGNGTSRHVIEMKYL